MTKKLRVVLLALMNVIAINGAQSQTIIASGTCFGLTWILTDDNDTTLTISGSGVMCDYYPNPMPWTAYANSIATIVIGDSVTDISNLAFWNCKNLISVTIGESVNQIGESKKVHDVIDVFSHCENLVSINVNSNNTFYTSENGIFFNKSKTLLIRYPAGKTDAHYTIPESVTRIGMKSYDETGIYTAPFSQCGNLISVTIPNSVQMIGNEAFRSCFNLTTVSIPNSVIYIGNGAFEMCFGLTSLTLPYIGVVPQANTSAYSGSLLLGIIFGSGGGVTQYYNATQYGMYYIPESLSQLTITNETKLPYGALYGCLMLKEVTLSNVVTLMGEKSLHGCIGLEHIYVQCDNPPAAYENTTFFGIDKYKCVLHVPVGSKNKYAVANGWKEFFNIQEGVGIAETDNHSPLRVYPNPTNGQLRVSGDILDSSDIRIYDVVGQVVYTSAVSAKSPEINISHLANGLYFLKIDNKTVKVIKQ